MLRANFFENDLTSTAQHATMRDMKTTRAPRLPTGDSLTAPRLVSPQQTAAPVDKSAGVGCSPSLIWQRLNLSRAGKQYRGFDRAASRLSLADQIAGGEISNASADAPALPAPTTSISGFGSSLSDERCSHSAPRWQQPPLRDRSCRAATERQSAFKVRDSQTHIHTTERKQ